MPGAEPELVITCETRPAPAMHFAVNFGVFAGRQATSTDLRHLREALLTILPAATVLSELRLELAASSEAEVYQVRVEVPHEALGTEADVEALRRRVAQTLETWARGRIDAFSGSELTYAERAARESVIEMTAEPPSGD
jgi:hypothetical protein